MTSMKINLSEETWSQMWQQNSPSLISPPPDATQMNADKFGELECLTNKNECVRQPVSFASETPPWRDGPGASTRWELTVGAPLWDTSKQPALTEQQRDRRVPAQPQDPDSSLPPFYRLVVTLWSPLCCWQMELPLRQHLLSSKVWPGQDTSIVSRLQRQAGVASFSPFTERSDPGRQPRSDTSPLRFPLKAEENLKLFHPKVSLYVNKSCQRHLMEKRWQEKGPFLLLAGYKRKLESDKLSVIRCFWKNMHTVTEINDFISGLSRSLKGSKG